MLAEFMSVCSEFAERKFHLECGKIEFERQGSEPISFAGPGHITQTTSGGLEYLSYLDGDAIRELLDQRNARRRLAGSILRDKDFFQMRAISISGETWIGRVTEPNIRSGSSGSGAAHGVLYEIRRIIDYGAEFPCDFATLYVPKHIEFPKNATTQAKIFRYGREAAGGFLSRDCAEFNIDNEEIRLYPSEGHTQIECCFEKGGVDQNRHVRIQEALEFALGQLLTPCALHLNHGKNETTILRSSADWSGTDGQELPPLRFAQVPWQPEVYSIAEHYYRAIQGYEGGRNPSAFIWPVLNYQHCK
jgi:hypothetical protein